MAAPQLGIYLVPGRVSDPGRAVGEAEEAEALGFGRVWISERYDQKEAGVLCGAVAARTQRIGIATGLVAEGARHPMMTAALGATMQALSGERFELGLARGVTSFLATCGLAASSLRSLADHVGLLRRLWAGEEVTGDGPYDAYGPLRLADPYPGAPPPVILGAIGEKTLALAGRAFDGVLLHPFLTPEAVSRSAAIVRRAAEDAGRDPGAVRVHATIVVGADLPPEEELAIVEARAVTYFQMPGLGDWVVAANGWDPSPLGALRSRAQFQGLPGGVADQRYRREQLLDSARLIPPEWVATGAAVGTARACARRLRTYLEAGAHSVVVHGSSPAQCRGLVAEWSRIGVKEAQP